MPLLVWTAGVDVKGQEQKLESLDFGCWAYQTHQDLDTDFYQVLTIRVWGENLQTCERGNASIVA